MPLPPLATETDLLARKVTIPNGVDVASLLDAASAAIRDAAGSAITRHSVTLNLVGDTSRWLFLPVTPVREVTAVRINGRSVTDFVLIDQHLHRAAGWRGGLALTLVAVDVEAGYDEPEADIVDLCCSLVAAQSAAIENGYDPQRGLMNFSIDDYRESYAKGEDEVINPLELPQRTRDRLRARFGITANPIESRR